MKKTGMALIMYRMKNAAGKKVFKILLGEKFLVAPQIFTMYLQRSKSFKKK